MKPARDRVTLVLKFTEATEGCFDMNPVLERCQRQERNKIRKSEFLKIFVVQKRPLLENSLLCCNCQNLKINYDHIVWVLINLWECSISIWTSEILGAKMKCVLQFFPRFSHTAAELWLLTDLLWICQVSVTEQHLLYSPTSSTKSSPRTELTLLTLSRSMEPMTAALWTAEAPADHSQLQPQWQSG